MASSIIEEAMAFAKAFFQYSLKTRLPGIRIHERNYDPETEHSMFTENIGKAIMYTWHLKQENIQPQFEEHFCLFSANSATFMSYAVAYGFGIYDETKDDVFERLLQMSAFILELVSFCYERSREEFMDYKCICWTDIFVRKYSASFYNRGGWSALALHSLLGAVLYDKLVETFCFDQNVTVSKSYDLDFEAGPSGLSSKVKKPRKKSSKKKTGSKFKNPSSALPAERKASMATFYYGLSSLMPNLVLLNPQQLDLTQSSTCTTQSPLFQNISDNLEDESPEKKDENFAFEQSKIFVEKSESSYKPTIEEETKQSRESIAKNTESAKLGLQSLVTLVEQFQPSTSTDKESKRKVDEIFIAKSERESKKEFEEENVSKTMKSDEKVERETPDSAQAATAEGMLLDMINIISAKASAIKLEEEPLKILNDKHPSESNFKSEEKRKSFVCQMAALREDEAIGKMEKTASGHLSEDNEQKSSVSTGKKIPSCNYSVSKIKTSLSYKVPKKFRKSQKSTKNINEKSIPPKKESVQAVKIRNLYLDNGRKSPRKKILGKSVEKREKINTVTSPKESQVNLEKITLEKKSKVVDQKLEIIERDKKIEIASPPKAESCCESGTIDSGLDNASRQIFEKSKLKLALTDCSAERAVLDKNNSKKEAEGNEQILVAKSKTKKTKASTDSAQIFVTNLDLFETNPKDEKSNRQPKQESTEMLYVPNISAQKSQYTLEAENLRTSPPEAAEKYGTIEKQDLCSFGKDAKEPSTHVDYFAMINRTYSDLNLSSLSEENPFQNKDESLSNWKDFMHKEYVGTIKKMHHKYAQGKISQILKTSSTSTETPLLATPEGATNYPPNTKSASDSNEETSSSSPLKIDRSQRSQTHFKKKLMARATTKASDSQSLDTLGHKEQVEKHEESPQKAIPMSLKSFKKKSSEQKWSITGDERSGSEVPRVPPIEPHIFDPSQLAKHGIASKKKN